MDFELSPDLIEIKRKVHEFAKREFTDEVAYHYDSVEKYPEDIFRKSVDEHIIDYSNPWSVLIATEELCKYDGGLGISLLVPYFGNEVIALFGNEQQKEKYINRVYKGTAKMGLAVTEPGGGSDVANIKTVAIKKDNHYIINGSKMFITNGDISDFFVLLARTSEQNKKHNGMSAFIVERSMLGFKPTKLRGKLGVRATDTAEILLENVEVPEENLIGESGKGFYYIMALFDITRVYVAAQALGISEGMMARTLKILEKQGRSTSSDENIQFEIAEMATRIEAAKLLTYEAAYYIFNKKPNPAITSMAKAYASETSVYVSQRALDMVGIDGLNSGMERFFRDAKITEIWEGTSEIERLVIARMLKAGDDY